MIIIWENDNRFGFSRWKILGEGHPSIAYGFHGKNPSMDGNRFSTFIHILHEGRTKGPIYEAPPKNERARESPEREGHLWQFHVKKKMHFAFWR